MPRSTILVVDDEPVITRTLVLILNNCEGEFTAIGTTQAAEALAILGGIHPDLVLLDAIMPGVKGLELALEIRDELGCKVLMMSGQITTGQLMDGLNASGHEPFEILVKPVHPTALIERIREMVHQPPYASAWKNPLTFRVH